MANTFMITQIRLNGIGNNAIIDWVYGDDNKFMGCCTVTSLLSIPLADRQDTEVVSTYLKEELGGSAFFLEKDAELVAQQPPPPE